MSYYLRTIVIITKRSKFMYFSDIDTSMYVCMLCYAMRRCIIYIYIYIYIVLCYNVMLMLIWRIMLYAMNRIASTGGLRFR